MRSIEEGASLTLEYTSSRREVWKFYWWSWRRDLWRLHLIVLVGIGLAVFAANDFRPDNGAIIGGALIGAAAIALAIAWPQLRFKPQTRLLTVGPAGLATTIGRLSCKLPWRKIASVCIVNGAIYVVRTNKNAFIVPARAFKSAAERETFLAIIEHGRNANAIPSTSR